MRGERGFTLHELVVVVAIFMTLSGIGLALLGSAATTLRADGQANRLIGLLQLARETAIMRQRDVEITFDAANHVVTLLRVEDGVGTPFAQVAFEGQIGFRQFDGFGDTPEGFGDGDVVDFGDAERVIFISDGSLVDDDSVPVNGTMFLGMVNRPETARAITLTGTTARTRLYRWAADADMGEGGWVAR